MNRPNSIIVSGWAFDSTTLSGLRDGLRDKFNIYLTSIEEQESNYVENLAALMQNSIGLGFAIAWSMGASVILETAIKYPRMFSKIILISSCARFCSDGAYDCGASLIRLRRMRTLLQRDKKLVLKEFILKSFNDRLSNREIEGFLKKSLQVDLNKLNSGLLYLENYDIRARLKEVQIPVLLLHGTADQIIPYQASEFLHANLPNSSLELFENKSHAMVLDEPQTLIPYMRKFLGSNINF